MTYYADLREKHGSDVRALGWGSAGSQQVRFKTLTEVANLWECTVLDYGCGFGDLCMHVPNIMGYIGYDNDPEMLAEARKRYTYARFADQPCESDYVLSSGVFNLAPVLIDDLMTLWHLCRKGVAVNFTSALADSRTDGISYADPFEVARLGAALTRKFALRHDYKSNDFTLYLYR